MYVIADDPTQSGVDIPLVVGGIDGTRGLGTMKTFVRAECGQIQGVQEPLRVCDERKTKCVVVDRVGV